MEIEPLKLQSLPIDINILMKQISDYYVVVCGKKGVSLHYDISSNVPSFFLSDELRIKQVLYNLTSNAIKFTEKGKINLRVDYTEELDNKNENSSKIIFSVSDTGIGIPQDKLSIIFEPFKQADDVNKNFNFIFFN